jgi:hypothetical protein
MPEIAADILISTLRVAAATGFVCRRASDRFLLTTAHATSAGAVRVEHPEVGGCELTPLARDETNDVALLPDRSQWRGPGLALLSDDDAPQPGEEVVVAGFPDGWPGRKAVVSRGIVAATDNEFWIDVAGTWGHSGGPICVLREGKPHVAGMVLGHAGQTMYQLRALVLKLNQTATAYAQHADNPRIGNAIVGGINPKELVRFMGAVMKDLAELTQAHFRTGFVLGLPSRRIKAAFNW